MVGEPDPHQAIGDAARALCRQFPDEDFRKIDDERAYPEAFVAALTRAGWLALLIPSEYGGSSLSMAEASLNTEEIDRSGGNAGACLGPMYLAAKANVEAALVCLQTHGGFGFAFEYDIERKFREVRLYQVAPISTNMVFAYVAEFVIGLPKSYGSETGS